jgi:hypothetical protein
MANEVPRRVLACAMIAVPELISSAMAETLMHRAENQVPVAIVRIERTADHTEIHLQPHAALEQVCFAPNGPNSPYLLANGQSYRYLGGDNVTACPQRRDYAAGDVLVMRFAPLEAGTSTFSFTSGGDKRSGAAVSPAAPSWNFVRVILN